MNYTFRVDTICPSADELVAKLARGSTVADLGCFGWQLGRSTHAAGVKLIGVDRQEPPGRPTHAQFARFGDDGNPELPHDSVDAVVASHILEHVAEPIEFAQAAAGLVRPLGWIWIEAPSELGTLLRGPDDPQDNSFNSFWDDPTHRRPWTPGSLYRLAISLRLYPWAIQRVQTGDVPSVRMLARKPADVSGRPPYRYVSLRDAGDGVRGAWDFIWGDA